MPTMENFQQLMVQNPAMQWMWNSVFISLVTMFLVCATSSLAGYVLAKKTFLWATYSICNLHCSHGASKTSCPCTIGTYRQLHGNPVTLVWAVILPLIGWPFGVFLMKQFSENIPTELLESIMVSGCDLKAPCQNPVDGR